MEFKETKGIFQQIADNICDNIISGEFPVGSKIPSVREQAAAMGVNQNTIMRTYMELQRDNIISNQRGIGFFVTESAPQQIINMRKEEFFEVHLPEFMRQVKLLNLSKEELKPLLDQLNDNHENK
ncbi:MAG TPA: GntR family transcriptional regulator [Prolixibacteraceae bacterium]|nr:GntR family transcriptional regulator [Prolixibacteraceae bacterium]HPR60305.1 GntR family transcriptional regulator [Prolixibacteraceae bacterium]